MIYICHLTYSHTIYYIEIYHIEVHTPDNLEKYVLNFGKKEEMTINYFETITRLAAVKVFFGKSPLRVVESPLVYAPFMMVMGAGFYFFWYRKRR